MIYTLEAKQRTTTKKSELTALRNEGLIPAVLYGKDVKSTPIAVDRAAFMNFYKKSFNEMTFYEIMLDGKKYHTILKDKLIHPVQRNILHMDFMVIQESALMEFDIPIQFIGEAAGTKEGGFTDIIQRSIKIICRAKDIPEEIQLDISPLHVGASLHVKDLPQGAWQYKDHADVTLVVIHAKAVAETTPVVEPVPAEEPAAPKPE